MFILSAIHIFGSNPKLINMIVLTIHSRNLRYRTYIRAFSNEFDMFTKKTIQMLGSKCISYFYICSMKRKKAFYSYPCGNIKSFTLQSLNGYMTQFNSDRHQWKWKLKKLTPLAISVSVSILHRTCRMGYSALAEWQLRENACPVDYSTLGLC